LNNLDDEEAKKKKCDEFIVKLKSLGKLLNWSEADVLNASEIQNRDCTCKSGWGEACGQSSQARRIT
jgi:hypothetical protein